MIGCGVTPGAEYAASAYVKAIGASENGYASLMFRGAADGKSFLWDLESRRAKIKLNKLGTGWNRLDLTFRIPTDGAWLKAKRLICLLGVNNATAGKIYIDDITITEKE